MSSKKRGQRIEDATSTKRRVAPLFAKRRREVNDDHVEDHDKINDGHKIREKKTRGVDGTTKTIDVDQTALLTPGISTTSSLDVITMEAELAAGGGAVDNYHIPANDGVLDKALEELNGKGLTPAWEADIDE